MVWAEVWPQRGVRGRWGGGVATAGRGSPLSFRGPGTVVAATLLAKREHPLDFHKAPSAEPGPSAKADAAQAS